MDSISKKIISLLIISFASFYLNNSYATPLPVIELTFQNGKLIPSQLIVPSNTKFKLVLNNKGNSPAEFESKRLRQEKVLAPGVTSFVVIHPLKPGKYEFVDEFHLPQSTGVIVAE